MQAFWVDSISFEEMVTGFTGSIDNHLPKNKILFEPPTLLRDIANYSMPASRPILHSTTTFSDANKTKYGILIQKKEKNKMYVILNPGSVQLGELLTLSK